VRGVANAELTPEIVLALGRAAARVLGADRFLVGRDTRVSGALIQAALSVGLMAEGVAVADVGVLPTPGVAWLSVADGDPAAVISASHNPFHDNGVKFFAAGGRKLSDEVEARLEAELDRLLEVTPGGTHPVVPVVGAAVGSVAANDGRQRYVDGMVGVLGAGALAGLTLVLDCAHGAASAVAPEVFRRLGATVHVLHDAPDGRNINDGCGSTHPEALQAEVVARGADVGLAFDGDADRVLAVDGAGNLVDGDHLIALLALDRKAGGRLPEDTVVVTVMANLGFRQAMRQAGITMVETDVGDRYVLEAMEKGGWTLGGEQSGHVIFRDLATTGDGILTGLQVLDVMVRSGRSLAELASVVERLPQVLRNVAIAPGRPLGGERDLAAAIADVEAGLGDAGRVLVRASGTEPVIRVMVEAETMEAAEAATRTLCDAVTRALGS